LVLCSVSAFEPAFEPVLEKLTAGLEPVCDVCKAGVEAVQEVWLHGTVLQDGVIDLVVAICEYKKIPKAMCTGLIPPFAEVVIPAIGNHYLSPEFLCYKAHLCSTPKYVEMNVTQVVQSILADAPPALSWPEPGPVAYRFLHVSDIHVDLLYQAGSAMSCPYESCCRFDLGTTNETTEQAGYWGALSNCDPPIRTVEAFLQQAAGLDIDFVLWTGDNPSADYWLYNRETHLQNSQALTDLFLQYFPGVPVYPIMGNHACYPQDQFHLGNEQWLTGGLADMWSVWLNPESQATFADNAYFSQKDNRTGLRILGINTQMCDNLNLWLILNDTDPGNHLEWLRQELYEAEASGELVLIIGHIPMGDHFCSSTWSTIYRAVVNRFRNIIRGQFFGHTHLDMFQVVSSLTPNDPPAGVLYIVPSFTTHTAHQPSFRVFEMDADTLQIVDYANYRLNLPLANQNPSQQPVWDLAYTAKAEYSLPDLSPASWSSLSLDFQDSNSPLLAKYWKNYANEYPHPGPLTGNQSIAEAMHKELWCGTSNAVFDELVQCAGLVGGDHTFKLLQELAGPWQNLVA